MFKIGDEIVILDSNCSQLKVGDVAVVGEIITDDSEGDYLETQCGWLLNYEHVRPRLEPKPRPDPTGKQTNPKDSIGSDKIPLHLWPTTASVLGSMALLDGGLKYGRSNFRGVGVRASIYIDALQRHLFRWSSGEDKDPDSGLSHLAHILAGVAILVDAQAAGKLNDDREYPGGLVKLIEEMTPHVKRLKEVHKDKSPHHYTIADNTHTASK